MEKEILARDVRKSSFFASFSRIPGRLLDFPSTPSPTPTPLSAPYFGSKKLGRVLIGVFHFPRGTSRHWAAFKLNMAANHQPQMDSGSISGRVDVDNPPFSRIFIVCSKRHTGEDMRAAFEHFGSIEDIWVVKDKHTKENRGVCYIKFAKASSAALACEEMDGKLIGEDTKPVKVR